MPAHRTWPREVACPWRTPWCWPMFSARRTASRRHSGRTSEGAGPEPTGSRSRVAPRHGAGSCHPPSVTPRCANEETRCSATATDRSSRLPEAALPALHHHVDLFRPHIVTAVAEFKKIRTTRPVRFRLKPSFDSGDLNGSSCPIPAVRDTRRDRLNWVVSGHSSMADETARPRRELSFVDFR